MKKLLVLLMACAVGLFIITGCGAGDKCEDYVDLLCKKCGEESDACKGAEEMIDADGYECLEDDAQKSIDDLEAQEGDDLTGYCESFM